MPIFTPRHLAPPAFWLGITACLILGALHAAYELVAGTRLDWIAERRARR